MDAALHVREYSANGAVHSHEFVQVVFQLEGELDIELAGRGARLSPCLSAFIAPGVRHTQAAFDLNRSLVLEAPSTAFKGPVLDGLARQHFFAPNAALTHLIRYAAMVEPLDPALRAALATLLIASVGSDSAKRPLLDLISEKLRSNPSADWTVGRMAREVGMSRSALYRTFKAQCQQAPGRFVMRTRVQMACSYLTNPQLSIAQVALMCGFSDQAAMTRAVRRETGRTPGQWRRDHGTLKQ